MVTTKLVTAQDLLNMGGRGNNYELIKGELIEVVPPNSEHGYLQLQIGSIIRQFVVSKKLGKVYVESGFVFERAPDTVLGPDVAFVATGQLSGDPRSYLELAPDLVVEIVSPGDSRTEIQRKVSIYLDAGARSVWVVYPQRREVAVHNPGAPPHTFSERDTITGGEILPGLSISVAAIFDD